MLFPTLSKVFEQKSISLYVNIPFCVKACSFCHYIPNLTFKQNTIPSSYIDLLISQLREFINYLPANKTLTSLYFGGGTPSLLSNRQLDKLFVFLLKNLSKSTEICMEIHPDTYKKDHVFLPYFNRYSIGVQSFDKQKLDNWKRITYDYDHVKFIVEKIRTLDPNIKINIDLLFKTSVDQKDLELTLKLKPNSITVYPQTGTKKKGEVLNIYREIKKTSDFLKPSYVALNEGSFIFVRTWNDRSQYSRQEYEVCGNIIGIGHNSVSFLDSDMFLSIFEKNSFHFKKKKGNRYLVAIYRSLPIGVPKELIVSFDKKILSFLDPHPLDGRLYFLPKKKIVPFNDFLVKNNCDLFYLKELYKVLLFGDTNSELLNEI